jgi:hypothetical protein
MVARIYGDGYISPRSICLRQAKQIHQCPIPITRKKWRFKARKKSLEQQPLAMAATTLCIYLYYEEEQQLAFFDDCFPSCLKSTQASVPGLLPRNYHPQ